MNNNDQIPSHPQRELEWLARYYYLHGNSDKAREIFDHLSDIRTPNNVIGMLEIYRESA